MQKQVHVVGVLFFKKISADTKSVLKRKGPLRVIVMLNLYPDNLVVNPQMAVDYFKTAVNEESTLKSKEYISQLNRQKLFIDSMPDAMWECDIKSYITCVDPAAEQYANGDFSKFMRFYGIINHSKAMLYNTNEERSNHEPKNYFSQIQLCSEHILDAVHGVLELFKLEPGSAELESREFAITSRINDALSIPASGADGRNDDLITFTASSLNEKKYGGDPGKLKQIIINFLGNFSKFTENGKITIKYKSFSENLTAEEISIIVTDCGPAIAWDQIFKPFFSSTIKMTNKINGSETILPLSEAIVKLISGNGISVENELGVGSKFYFNLNLKKVRRTI